ncbi:MAG TPA: hypothetical protein DEB24_04345 [Coriobacteriia bacterium]|nr:hypothetical protein [Coriobacteriia bacterium]
MDYERQIALAAVLSIVSFLMIRSILQEIGELYLRKGQYERRRRGQTFREWFLYKRFREEIPKGLIWLYYAILIMHPSLILCVMSTQIVQSMQQVTSGLIYGVIVFDVAWMVIIRFLSWKPGNPWCHYDQWVSRPKKAKTKRRGKGKRS